MAGIMPLANVNTCYVDQKAAEYATQSNTQKREQLSLAILDELLKASRQTLSKISAGSDRITTDEGNRITITYVAMEAALKNFDPEKSSFCGRYVTFFLQLCKKSGKKEAPEEEHIMKIRPNTDGIVVYEAPTSSSAALRRLNKQRTYRCLAILQEAQGDWYAVLVDVNGKHVQGYVSTGEDVQYLCLYSGQNEPDRRPSPDSPDKPSAPEHPSGDMTPEEALLLNEKLQISLFALMAAFYRQKDGKGLSRKALFCQFFTESIIRLLQETGDLLREPVYHEQLIIKNMRRDWQDHLLQEQGLDSFRRITVAQMKSYHDILQNGNHAPIRNKAETGVEFSIRLPYLKAHYTGTESSFRTQVSDAHTRFKEIFRAEEQLANTRQLSALAEEYPE